MGAFEITGLADIVRVHGAQRPGAVALHIGDRSISYAQLHERSNRASQAFRAAGIGFGDRVAFIDKNGPEYFYVLFGLAKLGAVCVAVNWRLAPPEMLQIIQDAKASLVVVGSEFFTHIEAIRDQLAEVKTVIAVGDHDDWTDFTDWIADCRDEDTGVVTGPDDVSFQLYTSGTTGLPKGVMLSNDNLLGPMDELSKQWRFDADSVSLAALPLFHIAGAGWAVVGLYIGCPTLILRDVDSAEILNSIVRHKITNILLVPAVIQALLTTQGIDEADVSTLRAIVYGASPISDDVLVRAMDRFDCEFIQVYGMTETTGAIIELAGKDHDPKHLPALLRSCGRPYPWVEMRIVDVNGEDVPTGMAGELWTRSRKNMLGYWNNPTATIATVTPEGWLKTGDAGYVDDDGYVFLFDRVKDMIVTGGENVYPAEIENVLMNHPSIGDVAVIGVPDPIWGEAVKAMVVQVGNGPSESEVIAFAREYLAGYKVPKSVDFIDALPRNPSGKILKHLLREPYWQGINRRIC